MKAYQILRVEKISTAGALGAMLGHCTRERETPNAAADRRGENTDPEWSVGDGGDVARGMGRWREMTKGCRVQKGANIALEYLVTASPAAMGGWSPARQKSFFKDSLDFIKKRHSHDELNTVIGAWIHRDEQNPHMHVLVVPKVKVKDRWGHDYINVAGKKFVDGSVRLSQMQTDFHKTVGVLHELERGNYGSKATHEAVRSYYGKVVEAEKVKEETQNHWVGLIADHPTDDLVGLQNLMRDHLKVSEPEKVNKPQKDLGR